jgi:hypothetical protein
MRAYSAVVSGPGRHRAGPFLNVLRCPPAYWSVQRVGSDGLRSAASQGIWERRSPMGISASPAAKEMPISFSERVAREAR